MTGFSSIPVAEEAEDGETQWAGMSRILGPKWIQLPLLTVGLLGVQILWSVEMSQG
jgi:solute carrier family 45, member 1/2/4